MIRQLPVFKGWTIDARLKQLRRVSQSPYYSSMRFIDFDSEQGDYILTKYIQTLDPNSEEFNEIARAIL